MRVLCLALMVLGLMLASRSEGDTISVAPLQTAVAPADESGVTRIFLEFSLETMREGPHRHIDDAMIEWTVGGVPGGRIPEFTVQEVLEDWNGSAVGRGEEDPATGEEEADRWTITPKMFEATGGFVRLDVEEWVRGWAEGTRSNFGVMLATEGVDREALVEEVSNVRLVVRYAFRD